MSFPLHEPRPLSPTLSPGGGEGARRAGEGESGGFMAAMRDSRIVFALHEPPLERGRLARKHLPFSPDPRTSRPRSWFMVPTRDFGTVETPPTPASLTP
jgi:hypothetical protein